MTNFADLTSPQVAALLDGERTPVLLLPVGAIEPHGPHAPLSTDPIISAGMCERAARRLDGDPGVRALILPPLPYGVTRYAAAFAGAVGIGAQTLHALLVDVCVGLVRQGFRWIVIVNNHFEPEHAETLRHAVGTVKERTGVRVGHLDLLRRRNAERLTEEFRSSSCHAGQYETSLVLAPLWINMVEAMAAGRRDFVAMGMTDAYCGAPAAATAAEGEATFETLTDLLVELVHEIVTE
jgi:creatinine amidohydrolase